MRTIVLVALFVSTVLVPKNVDAYPGFGKKMVLNGMSRSCQTCHVMFPKLNDYGKRVKQMGYDVPEYQLTEWEKHDVSKLYQIYRKVPVSLRVKYDVFNKPTKEDAGLREVQFLSAGNFFQDRASWWFHKHIVENNKTVSPFKGMPHEAWLQYNSSDALHVRVGMFELPLYFFPSKTKLSELPYLIYNTTTNDDNFGLLSAPQFGLQAYGYIGARADNEDDGWNDLPETDYTRGWNYALSVTNGRSSFTGDISTVFARVTRKNPINSVSLFSLVGSRERMIEEETEDHMDMDEDHHGHGEDHMDMDEEHHSAVKKDVYYRVGIDTDMRARWNFYSSTIFGKDFDSAFIGGFYGYDFILPMDVIVSVGYDQVTFFRTSEKNHHEGGEHHDDHMEGDHDGDAGHMHGEVIKNDARAFSVGVNHSVLFWQNVRLGLEYRFGLTGIDNKVIFGFQFAF